jgi:hypothetical protein
MRLHRAVWPLFGASCLLLALSACGNSKGSGVSGGNGNEGTGAGNGTGTGGTTNGAGGPNLGNVGGSNTSSAGGSSVDNECAGTLVEAQRIPLDMYVMLDVSGSMLLFTNATGMITKWQAVSSALTDFVSDPTSDGIGVGLQVFPIPNKAAPTSCTTDKQCGDFGPCFNRACLPFDVGGFHGCLTDDNCEYIDQHCVVYGLCARDETLVCEPAVQANCGAGLGACTVPPSFCLTAADCSTATYAAPAVAIAPLPGSRDGLVKVIQASTPQDGAQTPTGPALTGAIQQAKAWAMDHPDHQVVAVLATDGEPSLKTKGDLCATVTNADIQAVVDEAAAGLSMPPNISTFVIGVVSPEDAASGAPAVLNAIAKAGGTTQAFIVATMGDVQQQFRDALNKIRASGLSCDLAVPQAEAGKTLDYGEVNVSFDNGMGATDLLSWPDVTGCGAEGGWYYDVAPADGTPKRIVACPTTCADFEKTDMGSVQIKLGCKTRVVVK